MNALPTVLPFLDYAAVAVFGATGAMAAARKKHDIVTFGFFASATGVGGGTARDLLLGLPVFWVRQPQFLVSCLLAAIAVWLLGAEKERTPLLSWLDAFGLAAYAVVGAAKAVSAGASPLSAVVMGLLTASFGGVIRDVLAHEPSILLRREIYVSAALVGAAAYVAVQAAGLTPFWSGVIGFCAALALRAGAILWGWSLPGFPGRVPADP
jgi:uncharacterized membrane protein YeiH